MPNPVTVKENSSNKKSHGKSSVGSSNGSCDETLITIHLPQHADSNWHRLLTLMRYGLFQSALDHYNQMLTTTNSGSGATGTGAAQSAGSGGSGGGGRLCRVRDIRSPSYECFLVYTLSSGVGFGAGFDHGIDTQTNRVLTGKEPPLTRTDPTVTKWLPVTIPARWTIGFMRAPPPPPSSKDSGGGEIDPDDPEAFAAVELAAERDRFVWDWQQIGDLFDDERFAAFHRFVIRVIETDRSDELWIEPPPNRWHVVKSIRAGQNATAALHRLIVSNEGAKRDQLRSVQLIDTLLARSNPDVTAQINSGNTRLYERLLESLSTLPYRVDAFRKWIHRSVPLLTADDFDQCTSDFPLFSVTIEPAIAIPLLWRCQSLEAIKCITTATSGISGSGGGGVLSAQRVSEIFQFRIATPATTTTTSTSTTGSISRFTGAGVLEWLVIRTYHWTGDSQRPSDTVIEFLQWLIRNDSGPRLNPFFTPCGDTFRFVSRVLTPQMLNSRPTAIWLLETIHSVAVSRLADGLGLDCPVGGC